MLASPPILLRAGPFQVSQIVPKKKQIKQNKNTLINVFLLKYGLFSRFCRGKEPFIDILLGPAST
jgi:hypothetical protein